MNFNKDILHIDPDPAVDRISRKIRGTLADLRKRGLVVALSGGIDSSLTTALAAKAIGAKKVVVLLMPERDSSPETLGLSQSVADRFEVTSIHEDVTSILESVGFYKKYQGAVRTVVPEYNDQWKSKIVISNVLEKEGYNRFYLVAQDPSGKMSKTRLPLKAYMEIVAATNFKQRVRKMMEYYHADRLNYAVAGTPNRLEYDQGFFVKLGDGAADIKPIAHLYKTQVYQLAECLGVPEAICQRLPTTDTYSLAQGQDEFYFSLPYQSMDLCLYAKNNNIAPEIVADTLNISPQQVLRVYEDIDQKRSTTRYLHLPGVLVDQVSEISGAIT